MPIATFPAVERLAQKPPIPDRVGDASEEMGTAGSTAGLWSGLVVV
ncbi:MAG: hypothetical protein M3067_12920 [Chloroflexota bacterium]|nr:hypothetical protein [Chloroflexota bacterium]